MCIRDSPPPLRHALSNVWRVALTWCGAPARAWPLLPHAQRATPAPPPPRAASGTAEGRRVPGESERVR
eukprot:3474127-Rhodomonas_salina.1